MTESLRPLDLISKGKWDKALFTTYALSLSFYESQLHKLGLRRYGCRDISIITDTDGYQLSLSERQSQTVGSEFELIPAALPNGVFHPKIIWLQSKEVDLILLGSGNLTFGGFGKNVECLEVLRSDKHPQIFSQVAEMFFDWKTREDLRFGKDSWIDNWSLRSKALQSEDPVNTYITAEPQLLHSTQESIGQQLANLVGHNGKVREIRSLSPFYDGDANGILRLTELLNAPLLTIGLLPGREEKTTFPFANIHKLGLTIKAATIETHEDTRRLHAKILELVMNDGSVWTLTGSVNGTRKSLMTADNIETAILRRYGNEQSAPFRWHPCSPPTTSESLEFTKAGLNGRIVISASLSSSGLLTGKVICSFNPEGQWKSWIHMLDEGAHQFDLEIGDTGDFQCDLSDAPQLIMSQGLQIVLKKDGRQGTGWVALEHFLSATRNSFLSPSLTINLLKPTVENEDLAELLRYLSVHASSHLNAVSSKTYAKKITSSADLDAKGTGPDSRSVSIEWIKNAALNETENLEKERMSDNKPDGILDNLLRRILQNLKSAGISDPDVQEVESSSSASEQERERKDAEKQQRREYESVAQFHEAMEKLVKQLKGSENGRNALCIWLEAGFCSTLRRQNEPGEVEAFLVKWKNCALKHHRFSDSDDLLGRYLLEIIFTLSTLYAERSEETGAWQHRLSILHEELEAFLGDKSLNGFLEKTDLFNNEKAAFVSSILPDSSMQSGYDKVLATPTTKQQLNELQRRAEAGEEPGVDLPLARSQEGKEFYELTRTHRKPDILTVRVHESKYDDSQVTHFCSGCSLKLPPGLVHQLHASRLVRCCNCQKFLQPSI